MNFYPIITGKNARTIIVTITKITTRTIAMAIKRPAIIELIGSPHLKKLRTSKILMLFEFQKITSGLPLF